MLSLQTYTPADAGGLGLKLPKYFSINYNTYNYAHTIDIKIGSEVINTDFFNFYFTNYIKDFGGGWEKYNGKYITKRAVIN